FPRASAEHALEQAVRRQRAHRARAFAHGLRKHQPVFVELAARSNFSFLRGGSSPRAIIARAAELGYDAVGLADWDGLYGMVRALEAGEELGVRLVVGCELAIDDSAFSPLWLHVATKEGYGHLCRILTESHERYPKGKARRAEEGVARNQFAG